MKKQKMTSRDIQAQATKDKIYKVGIELIQKYGIDGVNVTQIAKAAGVSVGTFYHYYTSKLDLFMDLYRSADAYYENQLAGQIRHMAFDEQIQAFFLQYASMAENNGVGLTQKMYVPENSLFLDRSKGMRPVLLDIIYTAQKDGFCDPAPSPDDIADELFLIARGVIFDWALHQGEYDLAKKMEKIMRIYIDKLTSQQRPSIAKRNA